MIDWYHQSVAPWLHHLDQFYTVTLGICSLAAVGWTVLGRAFDQWELRRVRREPKPVFGASGKSLTYDQQAEAKRAAVGNELLALEAQAGIAEQAERARQGEPFPYGIGSDVEIYTKEAKLENEEYWRREHDYTYYGIRRVYFAVTDLDLRKSLIEQSRNYHFAWLGLWDGKVQDAQVDLARAKRHRGFVFWFPAIAAFIAVPAAWHDFQIPGAIIATFACYCFGQFLRDVSAEERTAAISQAEAALKEAENNRDQSRTRLPIFTRSEARTGEAVTDKAAA
jgi:hypothetical protein